MDLIEKYLTEYMKVGDTVTNKKTGEKWKIKHKNKEGGIYCDNGKRRTWFRETDMKEG